MAVSRKDKNRHKNLLQFKQKKMQQNEEGAKAQKEQKKQLYPQPEWQSDDDLIVKGHIVEAIQENFLSAYSALQKAGQAFQALIGQNIYDEEKNPGGKIKLKFVWNNGEDATEEEVANLKKMAQERDKLMRKQQDGAEQSKADFTDGPDSEDTKSSGLVTAEGEPLNKDSVEKKIIV